MILDSPGTILRDRLSYLGLTAFVLIVDRLSKDVIDQRFSPGESRTLIDGFFELSYIRNTGVAFGLFSSTDSPAKAILLSGLAVVAAVIVVVYSVRNSAKEHLLQMALALILGGAIGNLSDRLLHGYVIDFLYFHVRDYYWPAFNVADTAISVGVAFLAVDVIRDEIRSRT